MSRKKPVFLPRQQDYPATRKRLIDKEELFQLQGQREDGSWGDLQTAISDRDAITRTQTYRFRQFPEERQRVLRIEVRVYVDEIIGDGDGETTGEDLAARNDFVTQALLDQGDPRQSSH